MRQQLDSSLAIVILAAAAVLACAERHADAADQHQDRYQVAAGHYQQGRWQLAADEFRAFLAENPSGQSAERAHFYLGESLVQLRQFDQATAQFREYLRATPMRR